MASGYFTTDTLIEDIKRRAMIPTSQNTFKTVDFLSLINTELKIGIVPSVLSVHEEYYVYPKEVALETNKSSYSIPYRAIGGKLRDLFFKDTNGNLYEMARISPDDKSMYQMNNSNVLYKFYYLEGNNVVLTPNVTTQPNGSLVFTFFMRPSDLVEETRVATISSISTDTDAGTTTYNVDAIPAGMTVLTRLDLLQTKPGHKILKWDILSSAINSTNKTITFLTTDIDSETEVGDMIAFAGECIIPQCPTDLQSVLSQRVAARCLEALGDTQGLTNANTKLQEMEIKTVALIDNRVDGSPQKIVNRRGLLGRTSRRFGRRF